MAKPIKTFRQRMIEEQDDRNRRLARLTRQQRRRVRRQAMAVFCCRPCSRDVPISWEELSREGGAPKCPECGGPLELVTACVNRGVLPKVQ
jgi:hypothetical protein